MGEKNRLKKTPLKDKRVLEKKANAMTKPEPIVSEQITDIKKTKLYSIQEKTVRPNLTFLKIPLFLGVLFTLFQLIQMVTKMISPSQFWGAMFIISLFSLLPFGIGFYLLNTSYRKSSLELEEVLRSLPQADIQALEKKCPGRILPNVIVQGDYLYINRTIGTKVIPLRDIIWLYGYRETLVGILNIPGVKVITRDKKIWKARFTTEKVDEFLEQMRNAKPGIFISTTAKEKKEHQQLYKNDFQKMVDMVDGKIAE